MQEEPGKCKGKMKDVGRGDDQSGWRCNLFAVLAFAVVLPLFFCFVSGKLLVYTEYILFNKFFCLLLKDMKFVTFWILMV